MKKGTQILILVFLILVIMGGGYFFLTKMEILPVPAFLKSIPIVSSHLSLDTSEEESEAPEEKTIDEIDQLKIELTEKNNEIQKLNTELKALQKELVENQDEQAVLEQQVIELQQEVDKAKIMRSNKEDTYKNLAEYYALMKAKDAAEIMVRLDDEDIIGIFNQMKSEYTASILQNMNKDRAAVISKKMLVSSTI